MSPNLPRAAICALMLPTFLLAESKAPDAVPPSSTVLTAPVEPAASAPAVTAAQALEAIRIFDANSRGNLLNPKGSADDANEAVAQAANTLLKFTHESDAVVVDLGPEAVTWCNVKKGTADMPYSGERGLLFGAYLAGCIGSQLKSGTASANPYPGWVHLLPVYRAMKAREGIEISEIEDLMARQTAGTLEAYAQQASRRSLERLEKQYGKANPLRPADSSQKALVSDRPQ